MKKLLLSLGTLAAVVTPVAAVVACGNSSNEINVEKETAKGLVDWFKFKGPEKKLLLSEIDKANSVKAIKAVEDQINHEGPGVKDKADKLEAAIKTGEDNLSIISGLSSEDRAKFKAQIDGIANPGEEAAIVAKAQAMVDANQHNSDLQNWIKSDLSDWDMQPNVYLKRDFEPGIAEVKAATSKEELNKAVADLKAKINKPSVAVATKDDFVIVRDKLPNLFWPQNAKEITWTDMSKPDQPYITYKREDALDSSSVPVVHVYKNGSEKHEEGADDLVVIQPVNQSDYGFVLTDMSGSYHIDGVKSATKFKESTIINDFLTRSVPALHQNNGDVNDIKGMDAVLGILQPTDSTKDVTKITLTKDGKISLIVS